MGDSSLIELGKALGVAGPMVVLMFYLLRQCHEERRADAAAWQERLDSMRRELESKIDATKTELLQELRRGH